MSVCVRVRARVCVCCVHACMHAMDRVCICYSVFATCRIRYSPNACTAIYVSLTRTKNVSCNKQYDSIYTETKQTRHISPQTYTHLAGVQKLLDFFALQDSEQ